MLFYMRTVIILPLIASRSLEKVFRSVYVPLYEGKLFGKSDQSSSYNKSRELERLAQMGIENLVNFDEVEDTATQSIPTTTVFSLKNFRQQRIPIRYDANTSSVRSSSPSLPPSPSLLRQNLNSFTTSKKSFGITGRMHHIVLQRVTSFRYHLQNRSMGVTGSRHYVTRIAVPSNHHKKFT